MLVAAGMLVVACTSSDEESSSGDDEVTELGDGSTYEATIRRTDGGVPHITAASLADLTFGQGWASAEDRACDLADQVAKINGERARWFGAGEEDEHINSDVAWLSIGIREVAGEDWPSVTDQVRELITAYTDGWNAYLDDVGVDGISDWCAGAEWVRPLEPVEVYAYARSIALQASSGAVVDFIATARPPGAEPADGTEPADGVVPDDGTEQEDAAAGVEPGSSAAVEPVSASNGWAIGSDRSASGGGMLVANPHFPWEGQLRFWEVHLTVPGEVDIYGVQLSGLPGIGIGFTEEFGWTHTVSAGSRFTAYQLELVPDSPTSYRYGDEVREMTPVELTIEVLLGEDGEVEEQAHTRWHSHYGPILDFPGVGWTDESTIAMRDANIGNDEFIDQYIDMMLAADLDEFIEVHRTHSGVPLFNTIAVSADGRAWYADTSATPKLSDEAIAAYEASLETNFLVAAAAESGAILLDGSDELFEWEVVDGARDPGLVPFDEMPMVERTDYVFNANDSFWVSHDSELLEGDYSPLHGRQGTARSPRTRQNAVVLREGPDGEGGTFTLDELAATSIDNRGYTALALKDEVVARCDGAGPVVLDAVLEDEEERLPAESVDLAEACRVLDEWDGVYDIDRAGPPLWREFVSRYRSADLREAGALWAEPFDAATPVDTPSGLVAAPEDEPDPVLENLARAVQVLEAGDHSVDVTLGEVQVAVRNGTLVPIHGGTGVDGVPNVVGWGRSWGTLDPLLTSIERDPVAPSSSLGRYRGDAEFVGYRITTGTSFLMALEFGADGPEARVFLTYGNTADRDDPAYLEATERFSDKDWRDVVFDAAAVEAASTSVVTVRG